VIKSEFSASLLQSSVSHDPSEIILIETFLININVENSCAASYFCGNSDPFYFQDSFLNIKFQRTGFIEIESFVTL